MHQVILSTEGVIVLTVAQKGMKEMFYYPTQNLQRVFKSGMLMHIQFVYDERPWQMGFLNSK